MLAAYAEFDREEPKLPPGFEPVARLRAEAGFGAPEQIGLAARHEETLVFAIRGTDSFPDLIDDAEVEAAAPPFAAGRARCEAGAAHLYASLQAEARALFDAERPSLVRVAGHSLGGAVAALLACDLALRGAPRVGLTTFGSIRPGDWRFRRCFRRTRIEAWRVVNRRDLVPHWPPAWLCYRHVGRRVPVTLPGAEGPLEQHSMARYCEAVEALAEHAAP